MIHLARTSPPSKKDVIEESVISSALNNISQESVDNTCIKSIKDIPGNWVVDHARHVSLKIFLSFFFPPRNLINEEEKKFQKKNICFFTKN